MGDLYVGDRRCGRLDGSGRILLGDGPSEHEAGCASLDGTVTVGLYSSALVVGGVEGQTVYRGMAPWERSTVARFDADGTVYAGGTRWDERIVGRVTAPHLAASAAALVLVAAPAQLGNDTSHRAFWETVLSAAIVTAVLRALRESQPKA